LLGRAKLAGYAESASTIGVPLANGGHAHEQNGQALPAAPNVTLRIWALKPPVFAITLQTALKTSDGLIDDVPIDAPFDVSEPVGREVGDKHGGTVRRRHCYPCSVLSKHTTERAGSNQLSTYAP